MSEFLREFLKPVLKKKKKKQEEKLFIFMVCNASLCRKDALKNSSAMLCDIRKDDDLNHGVL